MNQNYIDDQTGQLLGNRPQLLTQSQQLLQTGQLPNQSYYPGDGGFIGTNQPTQQVQHTLPNQLQNQVANAAQQINNQNSLAAWFSKYWWLILALVLLLLALLIWWYCNKKSKKSISGTSDVVNDAPTKLKITKSRMGPLYE